MFIQQRVIAVARRKHRRRRKTGRPRPKHIGIGVIRQFAVRELYGFTCDGSIGVREVVYRELDLRFDFDGATAIAMMFIKARQMLRLRRW